MKRWPNALRAWLTPPRPAKGADDLHQLVVSAQTLLVSAATLHERGERAAALCAYRQAFQLLDATRQSTRARHTSADEGTSQPPQPFPKLGAVTLRELDSQAQDRLLDACAEAVTTLPRFLLQELGYQASSPDRGRVLCVAGVLLALLLLGVHAATAAPNLARGRPVEASTARFGAPMGLTNGAVEWGGFALQTAAGHGQSARIDLGAEHTLQRVRLYGRGDGYFAYGLPLRVELSGDGKTFTAASTSCTQAFTQTSPCEVDVRGQRARFVRISGSVLCLSEVEIEGAQ